MPQINISIAVPYFDVYKIIAIISNVSDSFTNPLCKYYSAGGQKIFFTINCKKTLNVPQHSTAHTCSLLYKQVEEKKCASQLQNSGAH